ncbi:hypothetical protein [Lachnoclostridium phytofermentans]|uniref:hypothetical protein n=1 Tax=Lachnoclostridium phytofermentans TaxID=66219 RepID=UPI0012FCE96B|nr:hypothetical protein [Lachnoclostridium phytofermentans]
MNTQRMVKMKNPVSEVLEKKAAVKLMLISLTAAFLYFVSQFSIILSKTTNEGNFISE